MVREQCGKRVELPGAQREAHQVTAVSNVPMWSLPPRAVQAQEPLSCQLDPDTSKVSLLISGARSLSGGGPCGGLLVHSLCPGH